MCQKYLECTSHQNQLFCVKMHKSLELHFGIISITWSCSQNLFLEFASTFTGLIFVLWIIWMMTFSGIYTVNITMIIITSHFSINFVLLFELTQFFFIWSQLVPLFIVVDYFVFWQLKLIYCFIFKSTNHVFGCALFYGDYNSIRVKMHVIYSYKICCDILEILGELFCIVGFRFSVPRF